MKPLDDGKTKSALLGAARTIARAGTLDSSEILLAEDETLFTSPSTAPPQVSEASAALDHAGPRYQRTELLPEGGMGQAWQASDPPVCPPAPLKRIRCHDRHRD